MIALAAGHSYAQTLGYGTYTLQQPIVGDATERGCMFAMLANFICRSISSGRKNDPALVQAELEIVRRGIEKSTITELRHLLEASLHSGRPICVLGAGETTVCVKVSGGDYRQCQG